MLTPDGCYKLSKRESRELRRRRDAAVGTPCNHCSEVIDPDGMAGFVDVSLAVRGREKRVRVFYVLCAQCHSRAAEGRELQIIERVTQTCEHTAALAVSEGGHA